MLTQEDRERMDDILKAERAGYAYVYNLQGNREKEFLLSLEPENLANFIGSYGLHADRIVITDVLDHPVADTSGRFLNTCQEPKLLKELISLLPPIQTLEREPGPVLAVDRQSAQEYAAERERAMRERRLTM